MSIDSFAVGLSVRSLSLPQNVGVGSTFAVLSFFFVLRLVGGRCRPKGGHRFVAYGAFTAMCFREYHYTYADPSPDSHVRPPGYHLPREAVATGPRGGYSEYPRLGEFLRCSLRDGLFVEW